MRQGISGTRVRADGGAAQKRWARRRFDVCWRAARWGQRAGFLLHDVRGQSTVELVIAIPVMLLAAVIAYNALVFFGDCAAFDRTFRNAVRVYAASGLAQDNQAAVRITQAVEGQVDEACTVRTTAGVAGFGLVQYTATLEYTPTLFGRPFRTEFFGVRLAALTHHCSLTVQPLRTG